VQTVDTAGLPVAGVGVSLNGLGNGMSRTTDANGKVTFEFARAPAGEASLSTGSQTYHSARRRFQINSLPDNQVQLTLMRLEEATPKVTGVEFAVSADAATLTVDAEISVTDGNARSIDTLALIDFSVPNRVDCNGFDVCIWEPSGKPSNDGWVARSPIPVAAALVGTTPAAFYRVRFVLNGFVFNSMAAETFIPGRTVNAALQVRLGVDTWVWLDFPIPL
jgi:hypothetical protein